MRRDSKAARRYFCFPDFGKKKGPKPLVKLPKLVATAVGPLFFPPELQAERDFDTSDVFLVGPKTDLLRTLYFQRNYSSQDNSTLDRQLVRLVLDHAKQVVAHPSRPTVLAIESFVQFPFAELALEETLEDNPILSDADDYLVEIPMEKPMSCVTMLDCSSSMTGEKHLLASIAVAVLLLEVPPKDTSVIVFSSEATSIKKLLGEESAEATILRFLKTQPKGFTNIERGLGEGLRQLKILGRRKRKVGLIATDGRSTEGKDPLDTAREYDFLIVLHLHGAGSHLEASKEIAHQGHGICLEVEKFEELPRRMYEAIRMMARL